MKINVGLDNTSRSFRWTDIVLLRSQPTRDSATPSLLRVIGWCSYLYVTKDDVCDTLGDRKRYRWEIHCFTGLACRRDISGFFDCRGVTVATQLTTCTFRSVDDVCLYFPKLQQPVNRKYPQCCSRLILLQPTFLQQRTKWVADSPAHAGLHLGCTRRRTPSPVRQPSPRTACPLLA